MELPEIFSAHRCLSVCILLSFEGTLEICCSAISWISSLSFCYLYTASRSLVISECAQRAFCLTLFCRFTLRLSYGLRMRSQGCLPVFVFQIPLRLSQFFGLSHFAQNTFRGLLPSLSLFGNLDFTQIVLDSTYSVRNQYFLCVYCTLYLGLRVHSN